MSKERSHADCWKDIEQKHFGQCIWQQILPGRRIMVELLNFGPETALVVKHFDRSIPKNAGAWPEQTASYVFLPVDDSNTWTGLDAALTERRKAGFDNRVDDASASG